MMYTQWTTWPFLTIIFWVCIFPLFWILVSRIGWRHGRHDWHRPPDKSAIDILKERYAKGEINKQEYEEKKRDIV